VASICSSLQEFMSPTRYRTMLYEPDINVETHVNHQWLILGEEDSPTDLDVIENCLMALGEFWLDYWSGTNWSKKIRVANRVTFYAWYDAQDGDLNFSLTSRPPNNLPFGARVALLDHPRPIIQQLLNDAHPGEIPLSELTEISPENLEEALSLEAERLQAYILPVWAITRTW
jgi:hypothetical protein